jgi:hypothetical protein
MNSTKVWFILTVIVGLVAMFVAGLAIGSFLDSHMQDRMVISCLKVEGTDLAYCKNLAAQVKL